MGTKMIKCSEIENRPFIFRPVRKSCLQALFGFPLLIMLERNRSERDDVMGGLCCV